MLCLLDLTSSITYATGCVKTLRVNFYATLRELTGGFASNVLQDLVYGAFLR